MEIESSGEIWGKGETSRRKTKIENVLIKKRKIVRESPKLHSKWHSHFGIRKPWFLSKSTPFPSASSEYSGPVPNSLFFFLPNCSLFLSTISQCSRSVLLAIACTQLAISILGTCQMQFSSHGMTLLPIWVFIYLFNLIFVEAYWVPSTLHAFSHLILTTTL